MKLREIPISEVAKHKGKKSNWIIIHNNVYDVTAFLTEHPGGEEALMNYAGKDGTGAFEDVGHSPDARELLTKFQIGYLPLQERNTFIDPCCPGISKRMRKPIDNDSFHKYDGSRSPSTRSMTRKGSHSSLGRLYGPIMVPKVRPRSRRKTSEEIAAEERQNEFPCQPESEGGGFKWWYLLPLLIILGGAFAARKKFMAG